MPVDHLEVFVNAHRLPSHYLAWANKHFAPVIEHINIQLHKQSPVFVSINGSQGSGKSTLAAYLQAALQQTHKRSAVCLSLDDFYLTKAERHALAKKVHPLLATRGVPGTHDVQLALKTLEALKHGQPTTLVRFDKSIDDRASTDQWENIDSPIDVVILEGWCMGASAECDASLEQPVNSLEKNEDNSGVWRRYVNEQLKQPYAEFFTYADITIMLKAPSFDSVFAWRWQQEQKLAEKLHTNNTSPTQSAPFSAQSGVMNQAQVARFIQHYQRLTEHMLRSMPPLVSHLYELDEQRGINHEQHQQCRKT
ncbi:zeta toxin family protein [Simiduia curdlanivorans]|uniref:Zeta toxin family protein n=1 Tax=Simiduia curdlanivorans TaxID=1492769 RepID=A0ABV8V4N8_9GAMM|nr:zeta toxin family protein [Simiduia curdlanivorans]MDN3640531.1 zeta toxin family protein [Simiduia curdlanivorans]